MSRMTNSRLLKALALLALPTAALLTSACGGNKDEGRDPDAIGFPVAARPVSELVSNQFSTESKRDAAGEADIVMARAGVAPGMSVADIGAGNGYYTERLSEKVGPAGRVLAQDIDPGAIEALATRVQRERLDNVSVITGEPADPHLPPESFDRIFLIHMYHEVEEPYAFLWHLRPALKPEGQVVVVDRDAPTDRHGISPRLLFCEMDAVGFRLGEYVEMPEIGGYYASFSASDRLPGRSEIAPCANDDLIEA